jgi:hypothetical protein
MAGLEAKGSPLIDTFVVVVVPEGVAEVEPDVGAEVGVALEVGLSDPVEESFTGVVGITAVGMTAVVTEPALTPKLLEIAEDVLDGSEAGTTPLLPVRPLQRPWHAEVVGPEPVVPGWRPWPVELSEVAVVVIVPLVVPVAAVPVVVVPVPVVVVPVVVVPVVVEAVVVVSVVVVPVLVVTVVVGSVVASVGVVDVVVDVVSVVVGVVVVAVVVVEASVAVVDVVAAAGVEPVPLVAGVVVVAPVVVSAASSELTFGFIASTTCLGERCASARFSSLTC